MKSQLWPTFLLGISILATGTRWPIKKLQHLTFCFSFLQEMISLVSLTLHVTSKGTICSKLLNVYAFIYLSIQLASQLSSSLSHNSNVNFDTCTKVAELIEISLLSREENEQWRRGWEKTRKYQECGSTNCMLHCPPSQMFSRIYIPQVHQWDHVNESREMAESHFQWVSLLHSSLCLWPNEDDHDDLRSFLWKCRSHKGLEVSRLLMRKRHLDLT